MSGTGFGYVYISVELRNGEILKLDESYSSSYGGYFWNGGDFNRAFDAASTGADVLNAIRNNTDGIEFIENVPDYSKLAKGLIELDSTSDIISINMLEETTFDDGDYETFSLNYEFGELKPTIFASPKSIKPSFINTCALYGDFSMNEDDFDNYLKTHRWENEGSLEQVMNWPYPSNTIYRFIIVGDLTAEKIKNGVTDKNYRAVVRFKEEQKCDVITESDFMTLGTPVLPFEQLERIDSLQDVVVTVLGAGERLPEVTKLVLDCGGYPIKKLHKNTGYIVLSTPEEYLNNGLGDTKRVALERKAKTDKVPVLTEEAFVSAAKVLPLPEVKAIDCQNKKVAIVGTGSKKNLSKIIEAHGGTPFVAKKADMETADIIIFMTYCTGTFFDAVSVKMKHPHIQVISAEDFLKAVNSMDQTPFDEFISHIMRS